MQRKKTKEFALRKKANMSSLQFSNITEIHSIGQFIYDTICFGSSTQNRGIFSEKKHIPIGFKNNNECESLIFIFTFNTYKKTS